MQRRSHESNEGWLLSYADLITNLLMFFVMLLAAAQISRIKMQQISESLSGKESPASLSAIQEEIEERVRAEGLQELVRTDLTDKGLEVSLNSGVVFDSGSAVIRPQLESILDRMLQTLEPYSGQYDFAVEGHTDTNPIVAGAQYKSNWELSAARANAVRERLESVGIERRRIRVEGYADTIALPTSALEGLNRDQQLAMHRRVIVRMY